MPKMISILIKLTLIFIPTLEQIELVRISPPGDATTIGLFIELIGMLFCSAYDLVIKECVAPVSKSTVAGLALTVNVPRTTFGASAAVSAVTWLTLP